MSEMESEKFAIDLGWSCPISVIHVANIIHF